MVCADGINILSKNIISLKKTKVSLFNFFLFFEDVDLEVNTDLNLSVYFVSSQNIGQYNNIRMINKSFENVANLFGNNSNKSKFHSLNSEDACYCSVHKLCLSFCRLKIYR